MKKLIVSIMVKLTKILGCLWAIFSIFCVLFVKTEHRVLFTIVILIIGFLGLIPLFLFRNEKIRDNLQNQPELRPLNDFTDSIQDKEVKPNKYTSVSTSNIVKNASSGIKKKEKSPKYRSADSSNPINAIIIKENTDMILVNFEIIKRLPKHPIDMISSVCYYFGEDFVKNRVKEFENLGYFRIAEGYEVLPMLKVSELKELLRNAGLKVSGRKQELIDRVSKNLSLEAIEYHLPKGKYPILTPKGKDYCNRLLLYKEKLFNDLFDYMTNIIISKKDFKAAYKKMCEYESKQPFQSVIDISYSSEKAALDELRSTEQKTYSDIIEQNDNIVVSALAITFKMLGLGHDKYQNKIDRFCDMRQIPRIDKNDVINIIKTQNSKDDYSSYDASGFQQYSILVSLDSKTCEVCAVMDSKVFSVSEMKIGKNAPPFHDGCRCTTVAYFPPDEIDDLFEESKRIARDPITGKNYYVPGSMTYSKWLKSLSKEARNIVKRQQKRHF